MFETYSGRDFRKRPGRGVREVAARPGTYFKKTKMPGVCRLMRRLAENVRRRRK